MMKIESVVVLKNRIMKDGMIKNDEAISIQCANTKMIPNEMFDTNTSKLEDFCNNKDSK